MKILYFAWLRQKIGAGEEAVAPPPAVKTVAALVEWLKAKSPGHAAAFANVKAVRVAINPKDPRAKELQFQRALPNVIQPNTRRTFLDRRVLAERLRNGGKD